MSWSRYGNLARTKGRGWNKTHWIFVFIIIFFLTLKISPLIGCNYFICNLNRFSQMFKRFTNSVAHFCNHKLDPLGRVGHRVALSICLSLCHKKVMVNNGQSIRFFVFIHKMVWLCMVVGNLFLEEHQNCMIC